MHETFLIPFEQKFLQIENINRRLLEMLGRVKKKKENF